jgi:hypothetical protein
VPDTIALASRTASSPDQQQFDAVRQAIDRIAKSIASSQEQTTSSADRIAASQGQMTRSLDQFTADHEQMTREITKLHEIEQSIRSRTPPGWVDLTGRARPRFDHLRAPVGGLRAGQPRRRQSRQAATVASHVMRAKFRGTVMESSR